MSNISRFKVVGLLERTNGRLFSAVFTKRNGEVRTLTGRFGVTSKLRGGDNTVVTPERPYLTVYDMHKQGYRTLNLATLSAIKVNGINYRVI